MKVMNKSMKAKSNHLCGLKIAKRKLEGIYARDQLFENIYMKTGKCRLLEKKEDKNG